MNDLLTMDDLVERLGEDELLQVAGHGSFNTEGGRSLDEEKIDKQIKFVTSLFAGDLLSRYPLFSNMQTIDFPEVVKGYASDIVRYQLRPRSGDRNTVTDEVRIRYEDAMAWLKRVALSKTNIDFGGIEGLEDQTQTSTSGKVRASIPPARSASILNGYGS